MAKSAKSKKKSEDENDERDESEAEESRPAPDSPEELARVRKRNTILASVLVAMTTASIGFVTWHRPRDPGRQWFKGVEARHHERVGTRLTRCFGGETAAQIRTNLAEVRRGTLPTALRSCRGATLTELVASPLAAAGELGTSPGYAENNRRRAWDAYSRLQTSLRAYERALNAVAEGQSAVPEAARDSLASAIDDVAADADSARNVINDMRIVVEENASWY
ncbi:MAG: hypothetical protein U0269_25510 [Polyangiales bacterium]